MSKTIKIDPELVEHYIHEFAQFGAFGETGVWRTVYTPEWSAAANQYATWCEEAGLVVHRDAVGNVWGRLQGQKDGKTIATGSHIDSVTPGGRYDGVLGALGGLIALRALSEQYGPPVRTLETLALCEEESSRFAANFWGSRAIVGDAYPEVTEKISDADSITLAQAMRDCGLDPSRCHEARRSDLDTFIELHIEQGPVLEQAGLPVAVVTGISGIRGVRVELAGDQNHAGAFPMDLRRDPMAGFAEIASGVIDIAQRWGRPAVTTIGRVDVEPNMQTVIPGRVSFSIDARHPDPLVCQKLLASQDELIREVAERRGLEVNWETYSEHAPCLSDPGLVEDLSEAARSQGIPFMEMASGAAHDTQQIAGIAKVAMLFIRSRDGRSHTPEEFSSTEDMVAGIRVLAAGLHRLAY
mgnify:CR=1 FL=1